MTYREYEDMFAQFICATDEPKRIEDLIDYAGFPNTKWHRDFIRARLGISKYATDMHGQLLVGIRAYQIRYLDQMEILPDTWFHILRIERVRVHQGQYELVRAAGEVDGTRYTIGYVPFYYRRTLNIIERQALKFLFQAHFQTKASDGSSKTQLAKRQNRQALRAMRRQ